MYWAARGSVPTRSAADVVVVARCSNAASGKDAAVLRLAMATLQLCMDFGLGTIQRATFHASPEDRQQGYAALDVGEARGTGNNGAGLAALGIVQELRAALLRFQEIGREHV